MIPFDLPDGGPAAPAADPPPCLLAQLELYWRALRGARRIPMRTDVDPAAIDAVLPHAFIAEAATPEVLRLRVAGRRLADLMGMDPRGAPLSAFFAPDSREALAGLTRAVLEGPALCETPLAGAHGLFRRGAAGRMLMLPLADGAGAVTRVMGAILGDGQGWQAPLRLSLPEPEAARIEVIAPAPPLCAGDLRLVAGGGRGDGRARGLLRAV